MDPETTLAEMIEAFETDDYQEAGDKAAALLEWLDKGGFIPEFKMYTVRDVLRVLCASVAKCEDLRLQLSLESDELTGGGTYEH